MEFEWAIAEPESNWNQKEYEAELKRQEEFKKKMIESGAWKE